MTGPIMVPAPPNNTASRKNTELKNWKLSGLM